MACTSASTVGVTPNTGNFCTATQLTGGSLIALPHDTYYFSYGGNFIVGTTNGTSIATITSGGCTACSSVTTTSTTTHAPTTTTTTTPTPTTTSTTTPAPPPVTTTTTTAPPTTTSTTTHATVNLSVNGKKSSGSGGTLYMWYSTDSGTTWNILNGGTNSGVLNTTCTSLGTTSSYPLGTVFTIMMSDISGPSLSTNYSVNATAGGVCPGTVTDCLHNTATPVAGGTLTIWTTGNTGFTC